MSKERASELLSRTGVFSGEPGPRFVHPRAPHSAPVTLRRDMAHAVSEVSAKLAAGASVSKEVLWGIGMALLVAGACREYGGRAIKPSPGGASGEGGVAGSGEPVAGSGEPDSAAQGGQGGAATGSAGDGGANPTGTGSAGEGGTSPWPLAEVCSKEPPPGCIADGWIPIQLRRPRSVAINTMKSWNGWHLLVSGAMTSSVAITWGDELDQKGWFCFDTVPHSARLAATSLTNDGVEWFSATDCGGLFVRRMIPGPSGAFQWADWTPHSLPSDDSFVLDVAASLAFDETNYLFIVDRGRVFESHRLGPEYAPFSAWQEVAAPQSRFVAAGRRADGRQQLYLVDDAGEPSTCIQSSTELGAAFEACSDFGSADVPPLVDIDAPYRVPEGSPVFAVDRDGFVWARFQDESGELGAWQPFRHSNQPGAFVSLAGATVPNSPEHSLRVVGITTAGSVFMTTRRGTAWGAWGYIDGPELPP